MLLSPGVTTMRCQWCGNTPCSERCDDLPHAFDWRRDELVSVLFGPDEVDDGGNEGRANNAPLDPAGSGRIWFVT